MKINGKEMRGRREIMRMNEGDEEIADAEKRKRRIKNKESKK